MSGESERVYCLLILGLCKAEKLKLGAGGKESGRGAEPRAHLSR